MAAKATVVFSLQYISDFEKYTFNPLNDFRIWQVSLQLSFVNICWCVRGIFLSNVSVILNEGVIKSQMDRLSNYRSMRTYQLIYVSKSVPVVRYFALHINRHKGNILLFFSALHFLTYRLLGTMLYVIVDIMNNK